MPEKKTNYQLYQQLGDLIKTKKPWSKDYLKVIQNLEKEPDYPIDDPLILKIMDSALDEINHLAPAVSQKVGTIKHILEVNFDTFDSFHYDLLSTYLYDLSEHLQGLQEPTLAQDELKKAKVKSIAALIESLAAICANNAQIM